MTPETRYARTTDGTHVAFQVNGEGPIDILVMRGWHSNLDNDWTDPVVAGIYLRLGAMGRVIRLDRRGTGLSDRFDPETLPTLEDRIDDIRAVMVAAGSERIALVGLGPGGAVCAAFAAMRPEQARGLVLWAPSPAVAGPDPRWATSDEEFVVLLERLREGWGTVEEAQSRASEGFPSRADDPAFIEWLRRDMLLSGTASEAVAQARLNRETVLRDLLPTIHVPTLVAWRQGSGSEPAARYVAASISTSVARALPGDDFALIGGDWRAGLRVIEDFIVTLGEAEPDADRVLATIVFTDLVGSTETAAALGDRAWRELLDRHHAAVRRALANHRGREIDTAGDGFFAAFDGPARAIRCAQTIRASVRDIG
ncbi:MAG TPA: adenylate/guanylate cyclase domain-containing protein, partial [Microbacterium sp.]|nr:adenylate/guanylate cyclase domain-containing protein [Microbacterium sp.]